MSNHIITLFGEELVPEQINAIGRSRAPKRPKAEEVEVKTKRRRAASKGEETTVATETENIDEATDAVSHITRSTDKDILEGFDGKKQYYSIGEVAAIFKVKTSHIRFWTNEFAMKVRTTRKGDRLFTAEQIREFRTIYHLVKERGFTIAGAKSKLKVQKKMDVVTLDLKHSLLQLRNKLLMIRNQLT